MIHDDIVQLLLKSRGFSSKEDQVAFLDPQYSVFKHDAFLLPDMEAAVDRLVEAKKKKHKVVVYGDYDIDGLTATAILLESLEAFDINVDAFIPNRFVEGYGLSKKAVETIAAGGAQLIVTVDCGSLSHREIARANELGVDVIVTDHHSVAETMPAAIATINPKRLDHEYPFIDLAGVGVAFKLVQALQTKLSGLDEGQEKWLLDLVALGTVCDVVTLVDENRANVRWGLEVMKKTRRPGLRALMAISGAKSSTLNARSLGFGLGPRLNASGRLETAKLSLDLLRESDSQKALELAQKLDLMNVARRTEQDRIFKEAIVKAEELVNDPVLIVSDPSWSHGIIGIVAAKLLERYHKPTFVLQELGEESKGSARSYGDFSAVAAIRATDMLLVKGGGHKLAAGVTIQTKKIGEWRTAVNVYYRTLALTGQAESLLTRADVTLDTFAGINESLVHQMDQLEPFGNGNPQPVFRFEPLTVTNRRLMGDKSQHVKYSFADKTGKTFQAIAFNSSDRFTAEPGEIVAAWCELSINEWQNRRTVEGILKRLELTEAVS